MLSYTRKQQTVAYTTRNSKMRSWSCASLRVATYLGDMHVDNGQAGLLIEGVAGGVHHQGHGLGLPKGSHQGTQLSALSVTRACMPACSCHFILQQDLSTDPFVSLGICMGRLHLLHVQTVFLCNQLLALVVVFKLREIWVLATVVCWSII